MVNAFCVSEKPCTVVHVHTEEYAPDCQGALNWIGGMLYFSSAKLVKDVAGELPCSTGRIGE